MSDETISQQTQHAFLVAWGHFAAKMNLTQAMKGIKLNQKKYTHTPQTKTFCTVFQRIVSDCTTVTLRFRYLTLSYIGGRRVCVVTVQGMQEQKGIVVRNRSAMVTHPTATPA